MPARKQGKKSTARSTERGASKQAETAKKANNRRKEGKNKSRAAEGPERTHGLYLGCFYFDDFGREEMWGGSFQIVVEAKDPEQAVALFQKRLKSLRETTTLFNGPITIHFSGAVLLVGDFRDGLVVNYEHGPLPEDDYRVTAVIPPDQNAEKAWCFDLAQNDDNGAPVEPFLDFGGQAVAEELAAEKKREANRAQESAACGLPLSTPRPMTDEERARARKAAKAEQELRKAERETKRREQEKAKERKKRRKEAIGATLGELGVSSGKRKRNERAG